MTAKPRRIPTNADFSTRESSIKEKARVHIQRKIATGELTPGSALSELSLAKELGTSRTPVREAISQLVAEGLLEHVPNRGAVVMQIKRQDIIDLYELREALEVYAVGKAARQPVGNADLERLHALDAEILTLKQELAASGREALNAAQMHRFVRADLAFHTVLMRLAGNTRLIKVVNETRLLIRIFIVMRREGHTVADLDRIRTEHSGVVDALEKGDAEHAMRLLAEHIQRSERERLEQYDHWEHEASLRKHLPTLLDGPATAESL